MGWVASLGADLSMNNASSLSTVSSGPRKLGLLHCREVLRIPFGEGNGNPLQYSCLENPMDRGAWQAAVHGEAKSQT